MVRARRSPWVSKTQSPMFQYLPVTFFDGRLRPSGVAMSRLNSAFLIVSSQKKLKESAHEYHT